MVKFCKCGFFLGSFDFIYFFLNYRIDIFFGWVFNMLVIQLYLFNLAFLFTYLYLWSLFLQKCNFCYLTCLLFGWEHSIWGTLCCCGGQRFKSILIVNGLIIQLGLFNLFLHLNDLVGIFLFLGRIFSFKSHFLNTQSFLNILILFKVN